MAANISIAYCVPDTALLSVTEYSKQSSEVWVPVFLIMLKHGLSNSSKVITPTKWWSHDLNLDKSPRILCS